LFHKKWAQFRLEKTHIIGVNAQKRHICNFDIDDPMNINQEITAKMTVDYIWVC